MVILHDAIKTIENGVFVLFFEEKKPVLFQKKPKPPGLKKRRLGFLKKLGFFANLVIFQSFCVIFP